MQCGQSGPPDAGRDQAGGPHTHHRWLRQETSTLLAWSAALRTKLTDVLFSAALCVAHGTNCNTSQRKRHALYTQYSVIHQCLYSPLSGPGRFISFVILYTVDRTPWKGDQPVARHRHIHRTEQTQNKSTQTFMPRVGFEPTTIALERAKTVHVRDRVATTISVYTILR